MRAPSRVSASSSSPSPFSVSRGRPSARLQPRQPRSIRTPGPTSTPEKVRVPSRLERLFGDDADDAPRAKVGRDAHAPVRHSGTFLNAFWNAFRNLPAHDEPVPRGDDDAATRHPHLHRRERSLVVKPRRLRRLRHPDDEPQGGREQVVDVIERVAAADGATRRQHDPRRRPRVRVAFFRRLFFQSTSSFLAFVRSDRLFECTSPLMTSLTRRGHPTRYSRPPRRARSFDGILPLVVVVVVIYVESLLRSQRRLHRGQNAFRQKRCRIVPTLWA